MKKPHRFNAAGFALTGAAIMIVGLLDSCFSFRMSEKKLLRKLSATGYPHRVGYYEIQDWRIHYAEIGHADMPPVLLIHGAPGSLADFINIMTDKHLLSKAKLIAVDRPGYGRSNSRRSLVSVQKQAELIAPLLSHSRHSRKPIVVGHSYGGTIAARLAMDFADSVGALVLVAGGFDPLHERRFVINPIIDHWSIKWLIPWALRVSNDEKLAHPAELEAMKPHWEKVTAPTTLIHGKTDWIVPFQNSLFAQKMLVNSSRVDTVYRDNLSHLIPFQNPKLITEAILKYL